MVTLRQSKRLKKRIKSLEDAVQFLMNDKYQGKVAEHIVDGRQRRFIVGCAAFSNGGEIMLWGIWGEPEMLKPVKLSECVLIEAEKKPKKKK